jgi:hypothetical protein
MALMPAEKRDQLLAEASAGPRPRERRFHMNDSMILEVLKVGQDIEYFAAEENRLMQARIY